MKVIDFDEYQRVKKERAKLKVALRVERKKKQISVDAVALLISEAAIVENDLLINVNGLAQLIVEGIEDDSLAI